MIEELDQLLKTGAHKRGTPEFDALTLPASQIAALVEYVKAAEDFRKAYFDPEHFGGNTREMAVRWACARALLGL